MKLNLKALGLACAILYVIAVIWIYIISWAGVSQAPFELINGFYLNWLSKIGSPFLSFVVALIIAFIDGFVAGVIFAWIYNRFARAG